MKPKSPLMLVVPLYASCLMLFIASSCKTQTQTEVIYKTSSGAQVTATTALKVWNDYLVKHPEITPAQELAVQKLYDRYRISQKAILDYAITSMSNTNVNTNTNQLDILISDTSIALSELIQLLTSFGVKL